MKRASELKYSNASLRQEYNTALRQVDIAVSDAVRRNAHSTTLSVQCSAQVLSLIQRKLSLLGYSSYVKSDELIVSF